MEDPDYILDIKGIAKDAAETDDQKITEGKPVVGDRRCIYVQFDCCGTYSHVYKNRNGTAYEGRCPKCLRPIKIKIGSGGTDNRFFRVE